MAAEKILSTLAINITASNAELQKKLKETNKSVGGLQKKIGGLGKMIAGAFAAGAIIAAAKSVFAFSQKIGEATTAVQKLTNITGSELTSVTSQVKSISDVFKKDFNEVLLSANTFSKEMGISLTESLDLIEKGFISGADSSGQLLDMLKEYPTQFAAAQMDAEKMMSVITTTVKAGIFSDKGPDLIKEATLRLTEMTPAVEAALKGIGISGKEITKELSAGTKTVDQVISMVSKKLSTMPRQAKEVATVYADVFGGAGEDVGMFVTKLHEIPDTMDLAVKQAGEYGKSQLRLTKASTELNKVWVKMFGKSSVGWTKMKASALEFAAEGIKKVQRGLVDTINYFIKLWNESMLFRAAITAIKLSFDIAWLNIKFFFESMFDLFKMAGDILIHTFDPTNWFSGDFKEKFVKIITKGFDKLEKDAKQFGKDMAIKVKDAVESVLKRDPIEFVSLDEAEKAGTEIGSAIGKAIVQSIIEELRGLRDLNDKDNISKDFIGSYDVSGPSDAELDAMDEFEDEYVKKQLAIIEKMRQLGIARAEALDEANKLVQEVAINGLVTLGESIGEAAAGMGDGLEGPFIALLNIMLEFGKQFGKILIAQGVAAKALKTLIKDPVTAIVAGVALVALSTAGMALVKKKHEESMDSFASGGVSMGGLALVGENGAEIVNLSKGSRVTSHSDSMKAIASTAGMNGGRQMMAVDFVLRGSDIYGSMKEEERKRDNSI